MKKHRGFGQTIYSEKYMFNQFAGDMGDSANNIVGDKSFVYPYQLFQLEYNDGTEASLGYQERLEKVNKKVRERKIKKGLKCETYK